MKILETERLRLRTLNLDDAAFYLEIVNDPAFIEYIGDRNIRTEDGARSAISEGPIAMKEALGHALYLVELKDGTPVGMSGLIKRETLPEVDIGYAFLPRFRGMGYATEAAAALLTYAPSIGIRRLLAITSPANASSNALLLKIGMRFERLVKLTPDDPGTFLYSIDFPGA